HRAGLRGCVPDAGLVAGQRRRRTVRTHQPAVQCLSNGQVTESGRHENTTSCVKKLLVPRHRDVAGKPGDLLVRGPAPAMVARPCARNDGDRER
nr:hypothetical protein [Tanacetum cinerariifolium]